MKLISFLDIIDIFPTRITLLRGNSSKVSTFIGKILSLMVFGYFIYSFSSSNMMMKRNPNSFEQTLNVLQRSELSFDQDNFEFVIGVNDDYNIYSNDSSFFGITAYIYYQNNTDLSYNYTYLDIEPCTKENFKNPDVFDQLKLSRTFCLKKGTKFNIHGFWDEKTLQYFELDVVRCVNETETICKSNEEIDEFLDKHYVQIYLTNNYIDVSDFENPLSSSLKTFYYPLAYQYAKKNTLYMRQKTLMSEYGILTREKQNIITFEWGNNEMEIYTRYPYIYTISIYSSDTKRHIDRNYQTFGNFLGELGGTFHFLFMIAFSLVKFEEKYKLTMFLGNKLMIFQSLKLKKKKRENKSSKLKRKTLKKQLTTQHIEATQSIRNSIAFFDEKIQKHTNNSPVNFDNKQVPSIKVKNIVINDDGENIYEGSEKIISSAIKNVHSIVNENLFQLNKSCREEKSKEMHLEESPAKFNLIKRIGTLKEEFNLKKSFAFGGLKYLLILLKLKRFCLNEEEKLYLQGEKYISQEMDIYFILKKLREMEKFKKILFNKTEMFFFNILPNPLEYLNNHNELEKKHFIAKKHENLDKMYFKLKEGSKFSDLDRKILENIHKDAIDDFF